MLRFEKLEGLLPTPQGRLDYLIWNWELMVDLPFLRQVSQVLAYWEFSLSDFVSY